MWKPFHRFFVRFRRQWGIQTTIMDAFVTFFFLSSTKLLTVSFSLLIPTKLYTSEGKLHSVNLYYDPSIKYFSKEHLPCAIMAIIIFIVFIAFPLSLLFFYQCKAYRKCLTMCQIRGSTLDEFVDTFQMYYKDGSNGTWDCRWFSGFYILLKLLVYSAYAVASNEMDFLCLFLIGAGAIIVLEPYKEEHSLFNTISPIVFLVHGIISTLLASWNVLLFQTLIINVLCIVPLLYITVVAIHHLMRRFKQKTTVSTLTSSLPDCLLHSSMYRDYSDVTVSLSS